MSFSIGLVGLPNVGKSTLFEAITKKQVPKENYPFCTIDPHIGTVAVPDERLDMLTGISNSKKTIYTTIEFTDIAGLVENAHKGEGLGNQFLSHIREVDAICQVVRLFNDSNVTHVHGKLDPQHDIDIINLELIMADTETVLKRKNSLEKKMKGLPSKDEQKLFPLLEKSLTHLNGGKLLNTMMVNDDEKKLLRMTNFLTIKPIMYAYNIDEMSSDRSQAVSLPDPSVLLSATFELAVSQMDVSEASVFLQEAQLQKPGIEDLITKAYSLLELHTFYTSGEQESRAWTLQRGKTAYDAASEIHTDIADGMVKADVVPLKKFVEYKGWNGSREAGTIGTEGREYVIKDGDVIYIHSTA